jgi:hypothetical protein
MAASHKNFIGSFRPAASALGCIVGGLWDTPCGSDLITPTRESMKTLIVLMSALMLCATAEAAKKNGNKAKQAKQAEIQKQKERKEREDKRNAVKEFLEQKDTNSDGSLTRDEFIAGESDAEAAGKKFDQFNKNKDRYLTKSEISDMLGL